MTDRATKLLLGIIAVALCANLFRPAFEPRAAAAATDAAPVSVTASEDGNTLYFIKDGRFYLYRRAPHIVHDPKATENLGRKTVAWDFLLQGSKPVDVIGRDFSMEGPFRSRLPVEELPNK